MKNFITYVLLRQEYLETDTVTEPCETGWASEAIFFIQIQSQNQDDYTIQANAQISVDGIHWVNHEALPLLIESDGYYCIKLKEFGGWLRLSIHSTTKDTLVATVQLALKG